VAGDELVLQSLPEDAPADLEARVFAADAQPGDPPRVVLPLSAPSEGADPRLERRVRLSDGDAIQLAALWDLGPGGFGSARTPRVEVRTAAGRDSAWPAIVLPLALPRPAEFVLPRSKLPETRTDLSPAPTRGGPRPHPAAPPILLSGMLLLTLAASLGSFARRGR
jgi:hypothetical protein